MLKALLLDFGGVIVMTGYLFGVFLVGSANSRFFAMAWSVIVLALPVPLDTLLSLCLRRAPRETPTSTPAEAPEELPEGS